MDFSTGKFETADSLSSAWRPSSELIEKVVEADEKQPFESTDGVQAFIDEALKGYQPPMVHRQDGGRLEGFEALAHPAVQDVDDEGPGASVVKRSDGSEELDDPFLAEHLEADHYEPPQDVDGLDGLDGFALAGASEGSCILQDKTPPRRSTRKRVADAAASDEGLGTSEKEQLKCPPPPSKKKRDAKKAFFPSVETFPFDAF